MEPIVRDISMIYHEILISIIIGRDHYQVSPGLLGRYLGIEGGGQSVSSTHWWAGAGVGSGSGPSAWAGAKAWAGADADAEEGTEEGAREEAGAEKKISLWCCKWKTIPNILQNPNYINAI